MNTTAKWIADNSSRTPTVLLLDLTGLNKGLALTKDANYHFNGQKGPFANGC